MPKYLSQVAPPILKRNSHRQLPTLPTPAAPTVNRPPPLAIRVDSTLTQNPVRGKSSLKDAIDYDKCTPTQQAQLDAGCFGQIELKTIGRNQYYYLRWQDPLTNKKRSTYLAKDYDKAIAKRKELING